MLTRKRQRVRLKVKTSIAQKRWKHLLLLNFLMHPLLNRQVCSIDKLSNFKEAQTVSCEIRSSPFFCHGRGGSAETCEHLDKDPSGQVGVTVVVAIATQIATLVATLVATPSACEFFPSGTTGDAVF